MGSLTGKVKPKKQNTTQSLVPQDVWDRLDAWRSRLVLLENEVQEVVEEQPDQAHALLEQLTRPLQLHQDAAQRAERRTALLGQVRPSARVCAPVHRVIGICVPDPGPA